MSRACSTGRPDRGTIAAFTLIELMITSAVCLFIISALVSGAIALQKCFAAQDDYATDKCD